MVVALFLALLSLLFSTGETACCASTPSYTISVISGPSYSVAGPNSRYSGNQPSIAVVAGCPVDFVLQSLGGHPFSIRDSSSNNPVADFTNGQTSGTHTWTVPDISPANSPFYYRCNVHSFMTNQIKVVADCSDLSTCATSGTNPTHGVAGTCATTEVSVTQQCTAQCNDGYTADGNPTRTCQNDGTLSAFSGTCTAVTCPADSDDPVNGVAGACGDSDVDYPNNCTTTCNEGFTGAPVRSCLASGQLSSFTSGCTAVSCAPNAVGPTHGEAGECGSQTFLYNETCTTSCNEGYTANAQPTRRCQQDGNLSALSDATCTAITCATNATAPEHGQAGNCGTTAVTYPNTCTTVCDEGYRKNAAPTRSCLISGELGGFTGECEEDDNGAVLASAPLSLLFILASVSLFSVQ